MSVITNNDNKCKKALATLQLVKDPEIGLNVVDLGLIYQLDFDDDTRELYGQMTLTTQFCPMGESITDAVQQALMATFPGYNVAISLTFNPRWTSELISSEGKTFLNK
jgi:metal-sulfur cluster biosynthetic enzyme